MAIGMNPQYNVARPESLSVRVATRVRQRMFTAFVNEFSPGADETILDLGVTSDQSYTSSNYLEALYPHKDKITAAGIDDARFLETLYPGVTFTFANALDLPFADGSFDIVHSSAVLEHVGSIQNQLRMVTECIRVARRGVCLTTPNRWFPIEFHTQLPLVHWLPKPLGRMILHRLGYRDLATEENLNLMSTRELRDIMKAFPACRYRFAPTTLLGWTSNLVLITRD